MSASPLRLGIIDNDDTTLVGLCALLKRELPHSKVVWVDHGGPKSVDRAMDPQDPVDLVLVDMGLEGVTGAGICREIRARSAHPALLAMTSYTLQRYAERVCEDGAQGIVSKANFGALCNAIVKVGNGEALTIALNGKQLVFDTAEKAHERMRKSENRSGSGLLSEREMEVMNLYAQAIAPKEIADHLGISVGSVKTVLDRVQQKLNVKSRLELTIKWAREC